MNLESKKVVKKVHKRLSVNPSLSRLVTGIVPKKDKRCKRFRYMGECIDGDRGLSLAYTPLLIYIIRYYYGVSPSHVAPRTPRPFMPFILLAGNPFLPKGSPGGGDPTFYKPFLKPF